MSINDGWLIELALKKKAAQAKPVLKAAAAPPVDALWAQLQEETRRQAKVYSDAIGDPAAVVIETTPDAIEGRAADGRKLVLSLDRATRRLSETFQNPAGALRRRKPIINFTTNAQGEVGFNFGGLQGAAGSILRKLV